MAAVFLALLYNSPAGLVLYWTLNNVFSLVKHIFYKVRFRHKKLFLFAIVSGACVALSFYILKIYQGDYALRKALVGIFILISIFPWMLLALKKLSPKLPVIQFYKKNFFLLFLFSVATIWIITGVFIPTQLIVSSPQEFSYIDSYATPLYFVGNTALQAFGLFVLWMLCLYFLFSDHIKQIFAVCACAICLCAICNVFIFPGNYGIITVSLIFSDGISHSSSDMLGNFGVLLVPVVLVLLLYFLNRQRVLTYLVALFLIPLVGISIYNIGAIQQAFQKESAFHTTATESITKVEPIFQLSRTGHNTVVMMLDRAHSAFLPYILDENPELKNIFSGFVYYPNTVSFNGYTRLGAPPIFGGYEYTPLKMMQRGMLPMVEKHNEALLLMPRLFSEADFEVTVTDPPYPNYSNKDDLRLYDQYPDIKAIITDSRYTNLWIKEHGLAFPAISDILKRNLLWYGIFRSAPLALRKGIYLQGDWCSPGMLQKITLAINGYSVLDYLPQLTGFKPQKENTALIMVNNTAHENAFLQAPEYRPVVTVTNYGNGRFAKEIAYHVNVAAIKRIGDWLEFLKTERVYDNTRIILVADHGSQQNYVNEIGLPFNLDNFNPLLLVKDFNARGALKTDDTFMSNADIPVLALQGQIDNPVNPFTGKPISMDAKKDPLYISITGSIHVAQDDKNIVDVQGDYYVHDNIFDAKNWKAAK
jgi:hypothetical protein